jgi:hypothetical protein
VESFSNVSLTKAVAPILPLLSVEDLKRPVRYKALKDKTLGDPAPLIFNRQFDLLGWYLEVGSGSVIVLPEYEDNDNIIGLFLNKILPKIWGAATRTNILDDFASPMEQEAKAEIQAIESERKALDTRLEDAKERLASAQRVKRKTIEADETSKYVIRYYETARQQENVALFFLYKIVDAISNKFGGDLEAKRVLGHNEEWNLIGRLANVSYADIRHAPKPGDKIREWSKEEIDACFAAAERILTAYLSTLF